ncbi:MAG: Glu-tRNA(Gln) amidotransferase subunit GatD [DPANN group archaeon]|nr:Glu-tRNA(Gln) amidotransferase subunit GatD [DPANN group archaeon]
MKKIKDTLETKKISVGTRLEVTRENKKIEGILLPNADDSAKDIITLKLDSGYNIGIKIRENTIINKSKNNTADDLISEENYEFGKKRDIKSLVFDKKKPKASLIATGGTISSRVDYKTGAVTMLMEPQEILTTTPELKDIINLTSILSPFRIASEDMTPSEWQNIAELVANELNSGAVGVIVTHGTDTLHYTAAALSFMLPGLKKPVALVGAQRSPDRASFDGAMNLICASRYITGNIAEVAIVMHATMNDDYCLINRGTKVRKMHTSRRDAFRPINTLPIGAIYTCGKLDIIDDNYKRRDNKEKTVADTRFDKKIAMINIYPGINPEILDWHIDKGYKGIVLNTTALGHVPIDTIDKNLSWEKVLARATDKGITIISASQTLYGTTHAHVYRSAVKMDKLGVIFAKDMLPETAYVKLGCVLGRTKDKAEIRELMLTNLAGEFSEKLVPKSFLY